MKNRIRSIAMALLAFVFVISTLLMLRQYSDNTGGESAYADALAIALKEQPLPETAEAAPESPAATAGEAAASVWVRVPVEDDPAMEDLQKINLSALQAENPDVVGWIRIPDTAIDYPLMQGEDNDFYLNHTWQKDPNSVGSIFLEYQNSADLTDYNTIVYGHNMNNGSMFADLELYALQSFWQEHPYVYIVSADGVYRYEIFAFCQAKVDSLIYGMNPQRDDTKAYFLTLAAEDAPYDTQIRPALTDRILTLSTCSGANYDFRYVVQARLPMMEVAQ